LQFAFCRGPNFSAVINVRAVGDNHKLLPASCDYIITGSCNLTL
jgi:hypothetical protein